MDVDDIPEKCWRCHKPYILVGDYPCKTCKDNPDKKKKKK